MFLQDNPASYLVSDPSQLSAVQASPLYYSDTRTGRLGDCAVRKWLRICQTEQGGEKDVDFRH